MKRLPVLSALAVTACLGLGTGTVHAAPTGAAAGAAGSGGGAATAACPGAGGRVVVRSDAAGLARAAASVRAAGGRVVAEQRGLHMLVADGVCAAALQGRPGVVGASADGTVRPQSLGTDAAGQPGAMSVVEDAIGARQLWKRGITGKGIDVAVIDTGVAPVAALEGSNKLVLGPDLSIESQDASLLHLDTYGHGTHMAGIIAGREGPEAPGATYAADTEHFYGVAPDARLVSLKVADRGGAVDVSQVIAAIDWVVLHRNAGGLNIRVLNLSYGTASEQDPLRDPLAYAAEIAVQSGIVVVASAGNDGDSRNGLIDPAYHPNVLAVGAADTRGTAAVSDDKVARFSAVPSGTASSTRGADVVAPGVSVVSLRVPGSTIAEDNPRSAVGDWQIKGSGTSQAAAVVSGAVALLLQDRPWLVSMHIKNLLMSTADPVTGAKAAQGAGEIDVIAASKAAPGWWIGGVKGTGDGSLEAARGGVHLVDDGKALEGDYDLLGGQWDGQITAPLTLRTNIWNGDGKFNNNAWSGPGWMDGSSTGAVWNGRTWLGRTWLGRTWLGRTWLGRTWLDLVWKDASWTDDGWDRPADEEEPQVEIESPQLQNRSGLATNLWTTSRWK